MAGEEVGVGTVIKWLLIILGVLTCLLLAWACLREGRPLIGLSFLALTAFLIIPRGYFNITASLKFLIFLIVFISLLVMIGLTAPPASLEYETHNFNDWFNISKGGNLSMSVKNVTEQSYVIMGEENVTTSGIYLIVEYRVKNLEKNPLALNLDDLSVELKDEVNNTYTVFAFSPGEMQLQPRVEEEFFTVFETPENLTSLKLMIEDDTNVVKVIPLELD